ncbi:uncharacterized protein [Misgurnus anguillicaudatus]|uniref:uncharacterized protein isoform X3 n=1 Tax=Misgurnus anguillicaudatus TaxID=75329 RepID=UPI003CCF9AB5
MHCIITAFETKSLRLYMFLTDNISSNIETYLFSIQEDIFFNYWLSYTYFPPTPKFQMDHRFMKLIFALLTVTVLIFSSAVLYKDTNTTTSELRRVRYTEREIQYCEQLRHKFSNITSNSTEIKNIPEDLFTLMRCPPMSNITQKELNRVRLRACCNATGVFYYTKQNTAVNQNITYETDSKLTYQINEELHNILPEDFPWSGRTLGHCAVVGNAGILKNSSCGREIDTADYVIRHVNKVISRERDDSSFRSVKTWFRRTSPKWFRHPDQSSGRPSESCMAMQVAVRWPVFDAMACSFSHSASPTTTV